MKKTLLFCLIITAGLLSTQSLRASAQCDNNNIEVEFATDLESFIATSNTKHISNIVVFYDDGSELKYDNLKNKQYEYFETQAITKVCVKSGCNKSNTGPGYGECFDACPAQSVSVQSVEEFEGNPFSAAQKDFSFQVTLAETVPSNSCAVTVNYATFDGSDDDFDAADAADYISTSGALTIMPGENSAIITVPVLTDYSVEFDEQFTLALSLSDDTKNATLLNESATGTILNDDFEF